VQKPVNERQRQISFYSKLEKDGCWALELHESDRQKHHRGGFDQFGQRHWLFRLILLPALEMAGFASVGSSEPVVEMADFAKRRCRMIVSRLIPSSRAIRRRDQAAPL
jgi:hypothetical protein